MQNNNFKKKEVCVRDAGTSHTFVKVDCEMCKHIDFCCKDNKRKDICLISREISNDIPNNIIGVVWSFNHDCFYVDKTHGIKRIIQQKIQQYIR